MANGDIIKFGRWITNSGDYIYDNYSEIDLSYFVSVQLDPDYTDSNALAWVEGQIDGHKCYFAKHLLINYMSYNKARQLCNNTYTINGNKYKLTLLTRSQWESLPSSVYSNLQYPTLYGDGGLQEYIFTSETRNSEVYVAYRTSNDQAFSTELIPIGIITDFDTVSGYVYYAPVLVSSNDVPDRTIVKIGAITLDGTLQTQRESNEYINQYYSTNTMPEVSLVDTRDESKKWSWLEFTDGGTKKYMCTSGIFLGCSYAGLTKSIKTVTIENIIYKLRFPTYDEFVALAEANLLGKINNYRNNAHDSSYFVITSSGGYAGFLIHSQNSSSQIDDLSFSIWDDSTFSEHHLVIPILELMNKPPTISGTDSNLGDKTQAFSIEYTVDDSNTEDSLTVTEKLNGTTIRTINSVVRNQKYYFNITSSMFANLTLYETNTVEIIVNDGLDITTRTYTFRKTNTAPTINYTGNTNLGLISSKPTINYSVTDAEGDEIIITERLNGKVLQTYTVSSGTSCTVNIPNMSWLGCGNSTNTIEINARDSAGGSSNKTITFTRAIDRIEVITNPIKTDKAVTKISLEVGWNTENASGQVFVCNNAYDASPTWENMTNSVGSNLVYNLTNTIKTAAEWGVSVKVIVKKDGGSTGEVSLYSIKGTYE